MKGARFGFRALVSSLALTSVLFLGACGPRGETKSLNEILSIAQKDFADQISNAGDVKDRLTAIQSDLESLISEQSDSSMVSKAAGDVAQQLGVLISRSGYTSRPSFTELMNQFHELRTDAARGDAQLNRLKLIATRTYSALASELSTTRFTVMPLSPAN